MLAYHGGMINFATEGSGRPKSTRNRDRGLGGFETVVSTGSRPWSRRVRDRGLGEVKTGVSIQGRPWSRLGRHFYHC